MSDSIDTTSVLDTETQADESVLDSQSESLQIPVDSESLEVLSNRDDSISNLQSTLSDDDIEEDDEDFSVAENAKKIIYSVEETYSKYYTTQKVTSPILTKFERAKLLGVRAEMISAGNSPMVVVPKNIDNAYEIALLELKEKKIPLIIRRYLPNGTTEDWRIEELIDKNL